MVSKCPDETLRMRAMNLNTCILRMLEDTFSLCAAPIIQYISRLEYRIEIKHYQTNFFTSLRIYGPRQAKRC